MKRLYKDQRGFSLVELLIAVVILGIIVTPLLHSFVTSAYTARRSNELGRATLAAQNLQERVETATLAELGTSTETAKTALGTTTAAFYEYDGTDYTVTSTAPGDRADLYHIGVELDEFDAMITLDPSAYAATINSVELTKYTGMDAVYVESDPDTSDGLTRQAQARLDEYVASLGTLGSSRYVRTITLDVEKDETDPANPVMKAQLTVTYQFTFTYTDMNSLTRTGTYEVTVVDLPLLPDGAELDSNPSLYILYCPDYDSINPENIVVRNDDSLNFTVNLVKQKTTGYETKESSYQAKIILYQISTASPGATILSNAGVDLDSGAALPGVKYVIRGSSLHETDGVLAAVLANQAARNRMYTVEIALYKQGSGYAADQHVYTLEATKLQ